MWLWACLLNPNSVNEDGDRSVTSSQASMEQSRRSQWVFPNTAGEWSTSQHRKRIISTASNSLAAEAFSRSLQIDALQIQENTLLRKNAYKIILWDQFILITLTVLCQFYELNITYSGLYLVFFLLIIVLIKFFLKACWAIFIRWYKMMLWSSIIV